MSDLLRRSLGEQVAVETVLAGGLWRVHVDPNQLEVAILNLAVNARDAMPEGGKLTIETANTHLDEIYAATQAEVLSGQYVVICVTDTGRGMTRQVLERAFEPFFTTKDVGHGTGLGLSQVYGFVKQSGGHVKIYSEVGEGTTVKIYLPRLHAAADEEVAAEAARDAGAQSRPRDRPGGGGRSRRPHPRQGDPGRARLPHAGGRHRPRGVADPRGASRRSSSCSPTWACRAA